ncbi:hypothetical protein CesoFtcFv8_027716 [Champsocephalus esox]|nr:hypothetical protein CesoFtcFv8_027716 [Champsocephalus esox]KAK5891425.1 hypothetical protein CgunFtcFv8_018680 [Champsocephalus gunnari]
MAALFELSSTLCSTGPPCQLAAVLGCGSSGIEMRWPHYFSLNQPKGGFQPGSLNLAAQQQGGAVTHLLALHRRHHRGAQRNMKT